MPGLVSEDGGIDGVRVVAGIQMGKRTRACVTQPDERAGQSDREREGKRPYAQPVVPVRSRKLPVMARAEPKGIAEDARVGEHSGDQQRRQRHAQRTDEDHAPHDRQREIDVQGGDELRPCMRLAPGDPSGAIDVPCLVVGGDDRARQVRRRHSDVEMLGLRRILFESEHIGDGRLRGLRRERQAFRNPGLFPALPFFEHDDHRAGHRDEVDQCPCQQADRSVAGKRALHQRLVLRNIRHAITHRVAPVAATSNGGRAIRVTEGRHICHVIRPAQTSG